MRKGDTALTKRRYSWRSLADVPVGAVVALILLAQSTPVAAQMIAGSKMAGFANTFNVVLGKSHYEYSAQTINCSVPGNVLWPGDQPSLSFQVTDNDDHPISGQGKIDVIPYGTRGAPGDIWTPHVFRTGQSAHINFSFDIAKGGFEDFTVWPPIPSRFGGYALVVDLGQYGRQFLTSVVRTFKTTPARIQYPRFCLDAGQDRLPLPILTRLGVHAIRYETKYKPTTDPDFPQWYAQQGKILQEFQQAGLSVLYMIEAGDEYGPDQPLGRPRPQLDANGVMQNTKSDMAWLPSYDADFQEYCYRVARDFGWPRGPINAFELWNEPWEGTSVSGWGADMPRYRDMYVRMFDGVDRARKLNKTSVLIGGCDSANNAQDKLFADGSLKFLPMFDFVSEHYQGLNSMATYKIWRNRRGPYGRVQFWDTESWVANTDDRVAAVVAGERAAGYDRAMGIYYGNVADQHDYQEQMSDGTTQLVHPIDAWSVAASVGASTHFIGERRFSRLLFMNGLPWVMAFDGLPSASGSPSPDDGTLVIVGDLGDEFGADFLPFRTARGFVEIKHKALLRAQMAALKPNAPAADRTALQTRLDAPETLSDAYLTLGDDGGRFTLYDLYGNVVPASQGKIVAPLDARALFLRTDGSKGSFTRLVRAVQHAFVTGIEPLAIVAHDFTAPIETHPALRLAMTNVLNRPVDGVLSVRCGSLALAKPAALSFRPGETKLIAIDVLGGKSNANNSYALSVSFNAGADGIAALMEYLHVNWIAKRTITVDGNLSDWKGILPQSIVATGASSPTVTEKAWLPFKTFDSSVKSGLATGYLAYDSRYFYFAAKVADATLDIGMIRMSSRDENADFYPAVSYVVDNGVKTALTWPSGVRRYSYKDDPELPAGNWPNHDNVQIGFNVLPVGAKSSYPAPPGVMPGFIGTEDTDYEYALNKIAPKYGGGTEIWRLQSPGMPRKEFYPRQPRSRYDGAVTGGKLVVKRLGDTLIYECAIPWTEMPLVKQRVDAAEPVKFTFRVNDNAGGPCMELSRERSVAKRNFSLHVDWLEHWSNELEFGIQK